MKIWKVQEGVIRVLVVLEVGLLNLLPPKRTCLTGEKEKFEERRNQAVVCLGCNFLALDNSYSISLNFQTP